MFFFSVDPPSFIETPKSVEADKGEKVTLGMFLTSFFSKANQCFRTIFIRSIFGFHFSFSSF